MSIFRKALSSALILTTLTVSIPLSGVAVQASSTTVPKSLTSIKYELENDTDGFANGTVTVTSPTQTIDGVDVVMYWADAKGNKLSDYTNLAKFKITGTTTTFDMYSNTIIPEGAEKLIAYTANEDTFSTSYVSCDLPDNCTYQTDESKFLFECQIISDIHTSLTNTKSNNRYIKMLNDVVTNSPDSKGMFVNGDITDHGLVDEYKKLLTLNSSVSNIPDMYVGIGNHDWWYSINEGYLFQRYANKINSKVETDTVYYDVWVEGYHFIFLGSETDTCVATVSDQQLAWLDKLLAEDTAKDPDKPVFVFLHSGIYESVAGCLKDQLWDGVDPEEKYKTILAKYGQVQTYAGHSHWDLYSERCMHAGSSTMPVCFNTASTSYLWSSYDSATPEGESANGSHGYYVRVYEDKVIYLGREFEQSKYIPAAMFVVESQNVSVSKTALDMKVGDASVNMNATSSTGAKLTYTSSNSNVASVDSNGNITALNPGVATVTVTAEATNTKTIARRSIEVTVTGEGLTPAELPFDFYGNLSYIGSSDTELFVAPDSSNWAAANYSSNTNKLWRFTKTADGTYKVTFKGDETYTLKGSDYWVSTEAYDNSDPLFNWYIFTDADGKYVLRNASNLLTLSVNENFEKKYLGLDTYSGDRVQNYTITQVWNLENHSFPEVQTYNGSSYFLDDHGTINTGWGLDINASDWYYSDGTGVMKTDGWICVDSAWYYMNTNGTMRKGWICDNGVWYYLNPSNGIMQTGWVQVSGVWYYFNSSGAMQTGWVHDGTAWYYLNEDGAMQRGWINDGTGWYYLSGSGAMVKGWMTIDGKTYYFNSSGKMLTGAHWIGGEYYVFDSSGALT